MLRKITKVISPKIFLIFAFSIFIIGEFSLRFFLGFCDAPLFVQSDQFEYIPKANQKGKRLGNRYFYNSFSQRSDEPDSTKKKILGLGDSIINGGTQTDQDSLATSLFGEHFPHYQMLNISAGSWGPDNCAAYLSQYGSFGAETVILFVSSHDAYDNMRFETIVGEHPSYPSSQYKLAWAELFGRYIIPKIEPYFVKNKPANPDQAVLDGIDIIKKGKTFNSGFDDIKSIADSIDIPLVLYLHADQRELKRKKYNSQGELILEWAKVNNLQIIKELDYNFKSKHYRDGIHLNEKGQLALKNVLISVDWF